MKKLVVFGIFVAFVVALTSCCGPSESDLKSLDSLNQQDKTLQDLNTTVDTTAVVDTTVTQ